MIVTEDTKTRELIIERATDLFFRYGFNTTTTQQIAAELEISKKTLYKYFPSKDELLTAVLQNKHKVIEAEYERILNDPNLDLFGKILAVTQVELRAWSKFSPQFIKDLCNYKGERGDRQEHERMHRMLVDNVELLLKQGMEQGIYKPDISIPMIVFIVNCMQDNLRHDTLTELGMTLEDAIVSVSRMITEGILTEEAREKYLQRREEA
jgi:AcrR family transcriptional regulator